jgi:uncharacterized protein (TIGR02646 family)
MKRIAGLPHTPPGLARFHADPATPKTWDAFGNFESSSAKRELAVALGERQHGLCAYCEIGLIDMDRRIEHVVPRSDPIRGSALACDHGNLLAVCNGGSRPDIFSGESRLTDRSRYLPPTKANLSCDASKENRPASKFIDPRKFPGAPSPIRVTGDGELKTDQIACASNGIAPKTVDDHIVGMNLNCERLNIARAAVRERLLELGQTVAQAHYPAWVATKILPNAECRLEPFFTTARSLFGPLAEAILAAPPQSWI